MAEVIQVNENLKNILMKHTHKNTLQEGLKEILSQEINRKIKKYLLTVDYFENKYGVDFERFEEMNKDSRMDYETEKNYLDWDMAVTVIEDLKEELTQLNGC
jgi:hypothetical protein